MEIQELANLLRRHFVEVSLLHFRLDHGFLLNKNERSIEEKRLADLASTIASQINDASGFTKSGELKGAVDALSRGFLPTLIATDSRRAPYYKSVSGAISALDGEPCHLNDEVDSEKGRFLKEWLSKQLDRGSVVQIAHQLDGHLFVLLHAGENEGDRETNRRDLARGKIENGQIAIWIIEIIETSIQRAFKQFGIDQQEVLRSIAELMSEAEYQLIERALLKDEPARWAAATDIVSKARTALTLLKKICVNEDRPAQNSPEVITCAIPSNASNKATENVAEESNAITTEICEKEIAASSDVADARPKIEVESVNSPDATVEEKPVWSLKKFTKKVKLIAGHNGSVLIIGETGTGKEFWAKKLHSLSDRASRPFEAINCAALPKELIDSELFGHQAGAFTGAIKASLGRIRTAEGGIVFLDELGCLPDQCWGNLLRFLGEKEIRPVGGNTQKVDVRVIAATNNPKRIPPDSIHRFDHILKLPPLRDRRDEFLKLIKEFFKTGVNGSAKKSLRLKQRERQKLLDAVYKWPGNIRQLKKAMQKAVIYHVGSRELTADEILNAARQVNELE